MKKLLFTALLSLMVVGVYAQKKTYKAAKKAFNKKEYVQAIELATQASQNPDTQDDPEVFTIIGKSNMYLFNENITEISYAEKAYEAFETASVKGGDKVREKLMEAPVLNAENERLGAGEGFVFLQSMINRQANAYFGEEDYGNSYEYYLISSKISPNDIVMAFYVGYSAYGSDNDDAAVTFYKKVIELNEELAEGESFENTQFAYNGLIDIFFARKEDYSQALEYIKSAKEQYPEEKLYKDYEIDVLIKSERMDEAIKSLKDVAEAGNATKGTFYTLAFLYWNNENFPEALAAADKALGLDGEYYDALYVAGSVHYNEAADLLKQANNTDDDAEYQELKKKALTKFKDAMPYFEKAIVQKPEDTYSLNPLSTIYDQLDMDAKRDKVLDKLESLSGGE